MTTIRQAWRFVGRRISPVERSIAAAARASRVGDWTAAAAALARAAARRPSRADILVQWGHALKESGLPLEAVVAYRRAAALAPGDVDARIHLAALLRRLEEYSPEVVALYGAILRLEPSNAEAMRALAEAGQRDAAPAGDDSAARRCKEAITALRSELDEAEKRLQIVEAFPLSDYQAFRERCPLKAPPAMTEIAPVDVVVLAGDGDTAAMVHASLAGIRGQSHPVSRVVVVADRDLIDHPVASVPDDGTVFVDDPRDVGDLVVSALVMIVPAGMQPEAEGLAWLAFALSRTGSGAAYGDHDTLVQDWRQGDGHRTPVLFGRHDPLALAHVTEPPAIALAPRDRVFPLLDLGGTGWDRVRALLTGDVPAVHVPRLVASRYAMPPAAAAAPRRDGDGPGEARLSGTGNAAWPKCERERIAVVVPTRDHPAMLDRMIASFVQQAASPELVEFLVLDNRSTDPAMAELYRRLASGGVRKIDFDQPFNWSRANNRGTAATDAPIVVYANNDVEMLTPRWDDIVRDQVSPVGVVGARLLYPDGPYQHAGVLFGVDRSSLSHHEGIGHQGVEGGPNGRWLSRRRVGAVTGAFMAIRRAVFDQVGGFDERLALAYNDLDFCLRLRTRGLAVVYDPRLTLIHHESKTRGRNVTRNQLAWDEREQVGLAAVWGADALRRDPGYNPQWARGGQPFDGLREPTHQEILDWIDAGANDPWGVA